MNTREKIVDPSALDGRRVTLVAAYFDPLLDWHAERLASHPSGCRDARSPRASAGR